MAQAKQMNIRVPEDLLQRIRLLCRLHGQTMNDWALSIFRDVVQAEYAQGNLDELELELERVAKEYLPGRVVPLDEMLALAQSIAQDDTEDGLDTQHVTTASPAEGDTSA